MKLKCGLTKFNNTWYQMFLGLFTIALQHITCNEIIIEVIESAVNITQLKHAWCRRLGHISSLDLHGLDNIHRMAFKKVSVAKV